MTIRVIELFAGIGAQAAALERLGLDHECVAVAEIDERAYRGYCAIHGDVPNLGDVTKIEHLPECDLLTYSFPCLGAGTLIQTEKGWKPIEDVAVGDRVWTDDGWRTVTKSMMTGMKPTRLIKPRFGSEIRATGNHPFLVRRRVRRWDAAKGASRYVYGDPEWIPAEELRKDTLIGCRLPIESPMPPCPCPELESVWESEDLWWTVGEYIASGWTESANGYAVIYARKGTETGSRAPFPVSVYKITKGARHTIRSEGITEFLSAFGTSNPVKRIPPEYLSLPRPLVTAMLDGYLSIRAHKRPSSPKTMEVITQSEELAMDISVLLAHVRGCSPNIVVDGHVAARRMMEGSIPEKESFVISYHAERSAYDRGFVEDGWLWAHPFYLDDDWSDHALEPVYDLEVEDRHCFSANNVIVHNCTDISMAGKREGMEEGSGTRSSLLWEVGRFLDDYRERGCLPEVLLMENVDAILFKANMPGFQRWMDRLADMGYTNSYQVLNAKDYGVPQNRKRCFLVSTLTKGKLVFPEPIPLKIRMKDLLEKDVPESFYLSEERIATFERHKKRQEENGRGFGYKPRDPNGDSERERE